MGKILDQLPIIWGIGIFNRQRDTLRLRRTDLRDFGRISGEPLAGSGWVSVNQGLSSHSGHSPEIPAETARHYSESPAVDCVVPATAFNFIRATVKQGPLSISSLRGEKP